MTDRQLSCSQTVQTVVVRDARETENKQSQPKMRCGYARAYARRYGCAACARGCARDRARSDSQFGTVRIQLRWIDLDRDNDMDNGL